MAIHDAPTVTGRSERPPPACQIARELVKRRALASRSTLATLTSSGVSASGPGRRHIIEKHRPNLRSSPLNWLDAAPHDRALTRQYAMSLLDAQVPRAPGSDRAGRPHAHFRRRIRSRVQTRQAQIAQLAFRSRPPDAQWQVYSRRYVVPEGCSRLSTYGSDPTGDPFARATGDAGVEGSTASRAADYGDSPPLRPSTPWGLS